MIMHNAPLTPLDHPLDSLSLLGVSLARLVQAPLTLCFTRLGLLQRRREGYRLHLAFFSSILVVWGCSAL